MGRGGWGQGQGAGMGGGVVWGKRNPFMHTGGADLA